MAYAIHLTIGTSNKVSINYQSQEVGVSLTYQLGREDTNVLALVREKTAEVAEAHRVAWEGVRDGKVAASSGQRKAPSTEAEALVQKLADPEHLVQDDAASEELTPEVVAPEPIDTEPASGAQQAALNVLLSHLGWSAEQITEALNRKFSCSNIQDLSCQQAALWLLELQRSEREKAAHRRPPAARLNGHSS